MAATGAFAPTNYDFLRSRMIVPTTTKTPLAPTAPSPTPPSNRLPVPTTTTTPRIPVPTKPLINPIVPYTGGIITETVDNMGGGSTAGGTQPAPSGTGTGGDTGAGGGGGGTSDLSRLMDLFGSVYEPRELTPQLAPTSVVETGTSDASGGSNTTMIIVVLLLAGGGFMWYRHNQKRKAA